MLYVIPRWRMLFVGMEFNIMTTIYLKSIIFFFFYNTHTTCSDVA